MAGELGHTIKACSPALTPMETVCFPAGAFTEECGFVNELRGQKDLAWIRGNAFYPFRDQRAVSFVCQQLLREM
jgi:hypothetical protein